MLMRRRIAVVRLSSMKACRLTFFSYAKSLDFFEEQKGVSFDLLKSVQNFVRGYEVEQCPLHLWENAILQGYDVFRQMRKNEGGIVIGNREKRTLRYKPPEGKGV